MNQELINYLLKHLILSGSFILYFFEHLLIFKVIQIVTFLCLFVTMRILLSKLFTRKDKFKNDSFFQFIFSTIEFVLHCMIYILFIRLLETLNIENQLNSITPEIFLFLICIPLIVILIYFLYRSIVSLVMLTNDIVAENKINQKKSFVLFCLLFIVLLVIIFSDIIFALSYSFIYSLYISNQSIPFFDFFYSTFLIHYTLPLVSTDTNIVKIVENINNNTYLRIIEIFHITFTKIIDLTVISIIVGNFTSVLKRKKDLSK